jgi:predicted nucleotidyltransferase
MTRSELLFALANVKHVLKQKYGIEEIALFGSYARGEAREESDVDIVILKMENRDLSKRLGAKAFLEQRLNKKIDLGYLDSMKTFVKNRIKKDFVYV